MQASSGDSIAEVQNRLRGLAKQLGWQLQASSQPWLLSLAIGPLRRQDVHVDFSGVDEAGHRVISIWSSCGAIDPSDALNLLRYNAQIVHGAFAVLTAEGVNQLVIRGNLLADTADPLELMRTVSAVAWQASQAQQRLMD
jgi:hypothetical protein